MADTKPAATGTEASTPPGKVTRASPYVRSQLADAMALSGYAVSTGVHTPAGEPLPFADVGVIQGTAANLGVFDPPVDGEAASSPSVAAAEWIAFEQAYYRLAVAMSPVTAETLASTQATMPDENGKPVLLGWLLGYSPALRFTRWFAVVAICFGAFVIGAECRIAVLGQDAEVPFGWERNILDSLVPWAYGALGSCAYLLRSAHYYIYQRSFDLRRKPEYFNRVLLGAISGGAIILFVNYLVDEDGTVLHLSSAALGFVAGYSTDFLFNTIERVVAAVFPKTDSDPKALPQKSTAKQPLPPTSPGGGRVLDDTGDEADEDANGEPQPKQPKSRAKAGRTSPREAGSTGER